MKVVVLTCSTGGGHNACANYIKSEFESFGITCDVKNYLDLVGKNTSNIIEKLYLDSTKGNGGVFGGAINWGNYIVKLIFLVRFMV